MPRSKRKKVEKKSKGKSDRKSEGINFKELTKKEIIQYVEEEDDLKLTSEEKKLKKDDLIKLVKRLEKVKERAERSRKKKREKIYCGDNDKIPEDEGYSRRGSRYECLRKGVGVGLYIISKKKEEKESEKKTEEELLEEENLNIRLKVKKKDFRDFFDKNFNMAKKIAKKETDIFYKLARMYYEEEKSREE
jgi:hypothetical protein